MKAVLFAAAFTGLSLAHSAFAVATPSPAHPATVAGAQPSPTLVVEPTDLPRSFAGGTVYIEFSLDKEGRPQNVRVPWVFDRQLSRPILKVFRQWQFAPATDEAAATNKRFLLPLEIRPQN